MVKATFLRQSSFCWGEVQRLSWLNSLFARGIFILQKERTIKWMHESDGVQNESWMTKNQVWIVLKSPEFWLHSKIFLLKLLQPSCCFIKCSILLKCKITKTWRDVQLWENNEWRCGVISILLLRFWISPHNSVIANTSTLNLAEIQTRLHYE